MIQPVTPNPRRKTEPAPKPPPMVQVAPRQFVQMDLLKIEGRAPEMIFCDLEPVQGRPEYYRSVPRTLEHFVRLTPELVEKLGLLDPRSGRNRGIGCGVPSGLNTLKRLIRAGFVDGARVAPMVYTVNLASYFQHLKRCAEDPDFWENPKVREEYRIAWKGGS